MTTLTFSAPKPLGFYSQSLQDKLYPHIGNGEKLTLTDATRLIELAGYGSRQCVDSHTLPVVDAIIGCGFNELDPFDGFDDEEPEILDISLNLEEWIAFSRWSSELAELRLHDYQRATRDLTPGQLAAPWEE